MKKNIFIIIMILNSIIFARGQNLITFQYDKMGKLIKESYGEKYELTNSYDLEGNLLNVKLVTLDMQLNLPGMNLSYIIYPNPVKDHITIELPDQINSSIEIYDFRGRKVAVFPNNHGVTTLSLQHLEPAVYILKIYQQTSVITRKIVRY